MDPNPYGRVISGVGDALRAGPLDPMSDLSKAVVIMRDKLRKSYLPFLVTVQMTLRKARSQGSSEVRDRTKAAIAAARIGEDGLSRISLGLANETEVKNTFQALAQLEGHVAYLYAETLRDVTLSTQLNAVQDQVGVTAGQLKTASEAFRRYSQISERSGGRSLSQRVAANIEAPGPMLAGAGALGGLALLGPLAAPASAMLGLLRMGGVFRRMSASRASRDVSMGERFRGALSGLPEAQMQRGGGYGFGGMPPMGPAPSSNVLQFPLSRMSPFSSRGAQELQQIEVMSEAMFLFYNKKAFKARWTKDVLAALQGRAGGEDRGPGFLGRMLEFFGMSKLAGWLGKVPVIGKLFGATAVAAAGAKAAGAGAKAAGAAAAGAKVAGVGAKGAKALGMLGKASKFLKWGGPLAILGTLLEGGLGATTMASEVFGPAPTAGQRVIGGVSGALAGTGAGLGKESGGSLAMNAIGNAVKFGLVGALAGPVGAIIGAGVGVGLALVGGQRIAGWIGSMFGMTPEEKAGPTSVRAAESEAAVKSAFDQWTSPAAVWAMLSDKVSGPSESARGIESARKQLAPPPGGGGVSIFRGSPPIAYRQPDPFVITVNEGGMA